MKNKGASKNILQIILDRNCLYGMRSGIMRPATGPPTENILKQDTWKWMSVKFDLISHTVRHEEKNSI